MLPDKVLRIFKKSDNRFRKPRIFSNNELKKVGHLFTGKILNASGWNDSDKQGSFYREYFTEAESYYISNYDEDKKGLQGLKNEFFLDLEAQLPKHLYGEFDLVFNHTTLEHIFSLFQAFSNLASLTRDVLIIVVPYIQQVHGSGYHDYWRFTPHSMKALYNNENMKLRYLSANGNDRASIYLFCIGYKSNKWDRIIPERFDLRLDESKKIYSSNYSNVIGSRLF